MTNMHRLLLSTLLLLTLAAPQLTLAQAPATSAAAPSAEQVVAKVEEYLAAAVDAEGFSGSVLIARDGKPLLSKGYGLANREWDVPNTPDTAFRIGSLTKAFTSAAVMLLVEQGKIDLSVSVRKYLTDTPDAWEPITIRHLLTHTSGIPNFTGFPDYDATMHAPTTPQKLLERFKDKPLEFTPGDKMAYSNSGYAVLGAVIEKASGKTYAKFLDESIFTPLGMTNSGYDTFAKVIKHRASGYATDGDTFVHAPYIDMSIPFAAGAIYSTVEDMLRWDQALYGEKLLTKKSLDEMFTPFKSNYGYGWAIRDRNGRKGISHAGGVNGFTTYIGRYPNERVTIIVLGNNDKVETPKIARDLSAIAFGDPYKLPKKRTVIAVAPEVLKSYVGEYELEPTFSLTVTYEDGKLITQATGQGKIEIYPEAETEFFLKVVDAQISFTKGDDGKVTGLILHQNGRDMPAKKVK